MRPSSCVVLPAGRRSLLPRRDRSGRRRCQETHSPARLRRVGRVLFPQSRRRCSSLLFYFRFRSTDFRSVSRLRLSVRIISVVAVVHSIIYIIERRTYLKRLKVQIRFWYSVLIFTLVGRTVDGKIALVVRYISIVFGLKQYATYGVCILVIKNNQTNAWFTECQAPCGAYKNIPICFLF